MSREHVRTSRMLGVLFGATAKQAHWALVDQLLSTGTNFLIALILVRRVSVREYGAFSLIVIIYVLVTGAVRVLNVDPLLIRHAYDVEGLKRRTPQALAVAAGIGVAVSAALVVSAALAPSMRSLLLVLAVTMPLLLVQDAGRALCFAQRRAALGAASDGAWAVVEVAALALVVVLAPDAPVWLLAATWLGAGAIAGLAVARLLATRLDISYAREWFADSRDLGLPLVWVFALSAAPTYLLFAFAPLVSGLAQLGAARAAYIPFGVFGVVLQGSALVLLPAAARRDDDERSRLARQASLALGLLATAWTATVLLAPGSLGTHLFGDSWGESEGPRRIFGICVIAQAVAVGPLTALRAMGRPKELARVRIGPLPVIFGGGLLLASLLGASGIAIGIATGEALAAGLAWHQLHAATVRAPLSQELLPPAAVTRGQGRTARMPRLLMVTTVPNTLTHFLLPYAREFRNQGWVVDAATGRSTVPDVVAAAFDRISCLPWLRQPLRRANLRAYREMKAVLLTGRYDIVHTHTPIASFVTRAAVAATPAAVRPAVVYTAHGFHFHPRGAVPVNWLYRVVEQIASRWTDRLVVMNETDHRAARTHSLVADEALIRMPGIGLDLDHYRPTRELAAAAVQARGERGIPEGAPVFTMMAELNANKNHQAVLRALAAHPRSDQHLVLLGAGPLQASLETAADKLGIAERVHFLGRVADVRPWILAAQATVLMSYREGLSRAVLESLAMGVPVVGARTRGIIDLVAPDGGVIVDPDDVSGIARAFDKVEVGVEPWQLRERLLPRLQVYSVDHLIVEHQRLYDDLLRRSRQLNAPTGRELRTPSRTRSRSARDIAEPLGRQRPFS